MCAFQIPQSFIDTLRSSVGAPLGLAPLGEAYAALARGDSPAIITQYMQDFLNVRVAGTYARARGDMADPGLFGEGGFFDDLGRDVTDFFGGVARYIWQTLEPYKLFIAGVGIGIAIPFVFGGWMAFGLTISLFAVESVIRYGVKEGWWDTPAWWDAIADAVHGLYLGGTLVTLYSVFAISSKVYEAIKTFSLWSMILDLLGPGFYSPSSAYYPY